LDKKVFNQFRELVYERSGISLGDNKISLVRARIAKRMRHLTLSDYGEYFRFVSNPKNQGEVQELVDAVSTNVTNFYREADHFEFMRKIIKDWVSSGKRHLRFWSAACSTGEEPYTIAIEILESIGTNTVNAKILATDINSTVLEKCYLGEYEQDRVEPVPRILLDKYFTRRKIDNKWVYFSGKKLKDMLLCRQINLSAPPFPIKTKLDVIFCRNVMIYFDRYVRTNLVNEFHRLLNPGGYLFVGHAESITGLSKGFDCLQPSVYKKK
jgi:chemotaxis protein methyltransferase CheR